MSDHGKHRLSDKRKTLGVVEWQPVGFCRRIGWHGSWDYDFSLCPTTHYHYDEDDNLVSTTTYPGHLRGERPIIGTTEER